MSTKGNESPGYSSVRREDNNEPLKLNPGVGYRHIQTLLLFLSLTMGYVMRSNLSVAIIAMTDKKSNMTEIPIYDWDKKTQDFILSSFFWGYTLLQLPSGLLAQRYGPKVLLIIAMTVNGMISVMFPFLVDLGGWKTACVLRMLQGLTQSCLLPSIQIFLSKWAPLSERSRLGNFAVSGSAFGIIVSMPTVGWLSGSYGWPISFQIIGAIALLMAIALFFMLSNRPSQHPKISMEERVFIESSLGLTGEHKHLKTPWRAIFTSKHFYALLIGLVGSYWGYLLMLLEVPSYLNLVLGVNPKMSGVFSSIPYIVCFGGGFIVSYISDYVVNKKYVSITNARKLCNTFGCTFIGFGLILLSFIPKENLLLSLAVLAISAGAACGFNCGCVLNHIDLAPNFAGVLMGVTNTLANGIGAFAPISAGYILTDSTDIVQWRIVFIMICVIMNAANLIFVLFGSSDPQPWNDPNYDKEDDVQGS